MAKKNRAAVSLGKKRWVGVSPAKRKAHAKMAASAISPENAKKRAQAAWKTKRQKAKQRAAAEKIKDSKP